ncbi:MAG TPA: tetratricopeptide repeat protein [Terriglobales bacterium]
MASAAQLCEQGMQARREHRAEDARRDFTEALAVARELGDAVAQARSLSGLAQIERDLRELGLARKHYEEAAALYRESGNTRRLAHAVRHVADVCRELHDLVAAQRGYAEALTLYRADEKTAPLDFANALRGYALLREEVGDRTAAIEMWGEARAIYASLGIQAGVEESERRLKALGQRG